MTCAAIARQEHAALITWLRCERAPPGPRAGHSPPLGAKKADHGDLTRRLARRERYVAAVCRWTRLRWAKRRPTGELLMTAPHARQPGRKVT
jgi:hypothetical protein